jgi:hypothetical protein
MFRKSTRNLLAVYFVGIILLHLSIAWRLRTLVEHGFPDFTAFYTAGMIVRQGAGTHLYDYDLESAVQQPFAWRAAANRGSILPFNHPPFEALLFVPFSALSYHLAFAAWLAVNLGILAVLPFFLRPHLGVLGGLPWWFWFLSCLAFTPNFAVLYQGQDSMIVLLGYCAAFGAMKRRQDFRAGNWLAAGLCKYHLVLPFLAPLLLQRRKTLFRGFLMAAVVLALAGALAVGVKGVLGYPGFVLYTEHSTKYFWTVGLTSTPNLRGLIFTMISADHSAARETILAVSSILTLALTSWILCRSRTSGDARFQLGFAGNLVATVLVSYHAYVHDLSLLWLVVVLTLDFLLASSRLPRWTSRALYACIGTISFSPLLLLLLLRYGRFCWVTWILLALWALLLLAFSRSGEGEVVADGAS